MRKKAKVPTKKISGKKAFSAKPKRTIGKRGAKVRQSSVEELADRRAELVTCLEAVKITYQTVIQEIRSTVEEMTTEFREMADSLESQISELEELVKSEEETADEE